MQQRRKESVVNFEGGTWNLLQRGNEKCEMTVEFQSKIYPSWLVGREQLLYVEEFKGCEKEEMLSGLISWRRKERKCNWILTKAGLFCCCCCSQIEKLRSRLWYKRNEGAGGIGDSEDTRNGRNYNCFQRGAENLSVPFPHQHYRFLSLHFLSQWNLTPLLAQL